MAQRQNAFSRLWAACCGTLQTGHSNGGGGRLEIPYDCDCQELVFRPMKQMTKARWDYYFPFLKERRDLAAEYEHKFNRFLHLVPDEYCYEAILHESTDHLFYASEVQKCPFCRLVVDVLRDCHVSEPSAPGSLPYEGITTFPPINFADMEDDLEDLRSTSPRVWLQLTLPKHEATPEALLRALEESVLTVMTANMLISPRFLVSDVEGDMDVHVPMYRPPKGPTADDLREALTDSHTGSPSNLRLSRTWLQKCRAEHPYCAHQDALSDEADLPSRLIDLSSPNLTSNYVVLRTREDIVASPGSDCEYATLSHRWGKTPMFTTTTKNLSQNLKGIRLAKLPKTFQEAVAFTRAMGIRYLWIDSVCILQDSKPDKEREIPRMVTVYKNAAFNIAACASPDSAAGLFKERDPKLMQPQSLPLRLELPDTDSGVGAYCGATATVSRILRQHDHTANKMTNVLEHRGWIFQERSFSRRVFSFEDDLVWFECREMLASENFPLGGSRSHGASSTDPAELQKWERLLPPVENRELSGMSHILFLTAEAKQNKDPVYSEHVQSLLKSWVSAISGYMAREFTFESDRLPGISGLASSIQEVTSDTYLAGLWKSHLLSGLCWSAPMGKRFIPTEEEHKRNPTASRDQLRAPTWSWACMRGPVQLNHLHPVDANFETQLEILDAWIRPLSASSPLGDAPLGEIRVRARMKLAKVRCAMTNGMREENCGVSSLFDLSLDPKADPSWYIRSGMAFCYMDDLDNYVKEHKELWVVPVFGYWPVADGVRLGKKLVCLLLKEEEDGKFTREGIIKHLSKIGDWEKDDVDEDHETSWFGKGNEVREIVIR